MDAVLIKKVIAHLAYPSGLITVFSLLFIISLALNKRTSALIHAFIAIGIFFLSSNQFIAKSLVSNLEQQYPQLSVPETPNADAIIVLGGSLSLPIPPRKFSQLSYRSNRFWLASKLYKAGKAPKIILSGGNVFQHKKIKPEAIYISEYLIKMGVRKEDILIEGRSRTTEENASLTNKLVKNLNIKKALLITSAIHMPRSMQLFANSNIDIIPTPSDLIVTDYQAPLALQLIPSSNAMNLTKQALHEYYGIWANDLKTKAAALLN